MAADSFLQFTLAARILGPVGVGPYALGLAIIGPLTTIFGVTFRDVVQARQSEWTQYRQLFGLRLVSGVALVSVALLLGPFVGSVPTGFLTVLALARRRSRGGPHRRDVPTVGSTASTTPQDWTGRQ